MNRKEGSMSPFENYRKVGNLCYISGQVPIKADGTEDKGTDFYQLAKEALRVIAKIVHEQGKDMNSVIKTTLYMTDITKLTDANKAYLEIFKDRKPARSALGLKGLADGANLEIDAVLDLS